MLQPAEQEVEQVWNDFAKTRSEQSRNRLMECYLHLVRYTAERIHSKLPKEVEMDDLISVGSFGLMHAIAGFDPRRGVKFETYCAGRIRGAILDELRSLDRVSRLARSRSQRLNVATSALRSELGRTPSDEELAKRLDVSLSELKKLTTDAASTRVLSLSARGRNDQEEFRDGDMLEDSRSIEPVQDAQRRDLKILITRGLTRAERLIVTLYYYEEMTMKEIGCVLDLSESRVSQMHSAIISRLQAQLAGRGSELKRASAA